MRVGLGFDVHPFDATGNRPLVLGGVVIEGETGLAGHSDADVVAHAVIDALLGAAGLGDIGEHFPDDDPQWHDADSVELLAAAAAKVRAAGFEPANVDCTVVLEAPRLAPHRAAMVDRLSTADATVKTDANSYLLLVTLRRSLPELSGRVTVAGDRRQAERFLSAACFRI